MTLQQYLEENIEDVVAELCQYQSCDNCSIDALFEDDCPLKSMTIDEALDKEIDQ